MNTLNTALGMVRKNCYMASVDLADAHYFVPVAIVDQKYLMFQFEGIWYMFAFHMVYCPLQEFSLNS